MIHKPSPRRPIHNSDENKEVSNSPQNSPKLTTRKIQKRSSGSERSSSDSGDEHEDEIVSPSTPSQKFFEESFHTTINRSFDQSCSSTSDSPNTIEKQGNRSSPVYDYRGESVSPEGYRRIKPNNTCATKSHPYHIATLIVIVLAIVLAYNLAATGGTSEEQVKIKKTCSFEDLKLKYIKEDDYLWKSLQAGTEKILNDDIAMPGVYLFLHTNNISTRKLISEIVSKAAYCFDPSLKHLELGSKDFTSNETKNDYGIIVEKYKNEIKEGGVLLIVNLNEIPGEAARALHTICDTYSPIVRRVMIFMTLIVSENPNAEENEIELAERTLLDLWGSKIKRSELDPLIARVTDQVFQLKSN